MLIPEPIHVCCGYQSEVLRYVRCDRHVRMRIRHRVSPSCMSGGLETNFDVIMQISVDRQIGSSTILIKIYSALRI